MDVEITIRVNRGEAISIVRKVTGRPAEREELAHALGRQVANRVVQCALQEAAEEARHPVCCGRSMQNRGRPRMTVHGLDGDIRIARRRYRCRCCGRESYAADGLLLCGRHRVTRPLAKRVCQLAAIERFTQLPQLLFDQHGVRLSHEELIALAHDVGGRRTGCGGRKPRSGSARPPPGGPGRRRRCGRVRCT